uniref:Uncharacterized protein n=1 Tax=Chenopodium quinoa TaxID=63459 RepID=A0A803LD13_CHEQI
AHDICSDSNRQIINADDVLNALEEVEFSEFIEPLRASLNATENGKAGETVVENGDDEETAVENGEDEEAGEQSSGRCIYQLVFHLDSDAPQFT